MKTKKLTPWNAAPVKRSNVATFSPEGNAIPLFGRKMQKILWMGGL